MSEYKSFENVEQTSLKKFMKFKVLVLVYYYNTIRIHVMAQNVTNL